MLKTSMEFRRGILFIRVKGDLNKNTVKGIVDEDFKYIVINIDDIYSIDSYSIKYLKKLYKNFKNNKGNIIICDKFNISKRLFKDIPKIDNEYDAFKLFERMI
ncbi:MAG: STAS domain-containing protein [Bacilli bacterium]|nr:STAS domain-containing protein [Bacilli bacterium]MDY5995820.1 STAS domain-containing protein [Bacilli bacterium]MEE1371181.1 STAS domain-containing protein [Bacilli bacterium]